MACNCTRSPGPFPSRAAPGDGAREREDAKTRRTREEEDQKAFSSLRVPFASSRLRALFGLWILSLALTATLTVTSFAADWPTWGVDGSRNMVAAAEKGLPVSAKAGEYKE